MRRNTLQKAIVVGTMLSLTALAGCTGSPGTSPSTPAAASEPQTNQVSEAPAEDIELRVMWWGGDARHTVTNEALDAFEAANPGIRVVRDYGGFDGYRDKLLTQYAGGQAPDVFQLYNEVLYEFAGNGQLMDLQQYGDTLPLDGVPADLLESLSVDGGQYALPFGLSTHIMAFNTKHLEAAGVQAPTEGYTWDDLKTLGEALSKAGNGQFFGVSDLAHSYQPFEVFAKQRGEDYMTKDGLGFTEQTLKDWWTYWDEMRKSGASTPADLTAENSAPIDMMIPGTASSGFLFANQFAATQGQMEDKLVAVRFPGEKPTPGSYLRTAMNIVMSSKTEHPEAAAKLIDFLVNSPDANAILGIDRGVPASAGVVEAATSDVDDVTKEALAIIESVRADGAAPPVPQPQGAANVNSLFAEISSEIAFGQISIDEGVAKFFEQAPGELS